MTTWIAVSAVACGAFVGGMMRAACAKAFNRGGVDIPWGTAVVNMIGSLLVGVMAGLAVRHAAGGELVHLHVVTGLCGGLTTFSTFTSEVAALVEGHAPWRAWWYWFGSVLAGLAMVWLGFTVAG